MSPPRRRRRRAAPEEPHASHERWAISYMDMVTVMMCLFIVLFAISQVDQQKFKQLSESLGAAFGGEASEPTVLDGSDSVLDGQGINEDSVLTLDAALVQIQKSDVEQEALRIAREEIASMEELSTLLHDDLEAKGLAEEVAFRFTDRGLVVGLITENVFFQPSQADLSPVTEQVLDTVAPRLNDLPNELSVEGHANVLPPHAPYETNWELSSDRATKVARRLAEVGGIPGERLQAIGFSDTRPLATGDDAASLAMNRRVDIVVITAATGEAREQLAQLLSEAQTEVQAGG